MRSERAVFVASQFSSNSETTIAALMSGIFMARPKGVKNKSKKVEVVVNIPESSFIGSVKLGGRLYQATGSTFEDLISNLHVGSWAKGVSVLTIEKDGVKREKLVSSRHTQLLFGMTSPTMKQFSIKWMKQYYGFS